MTTRREQPAERYYRSKPGIFVAEHTHLMAHARHTDTAATVLPFLQQPARYHNKIERLAGRLASAPGAYVARIAGAEDGTEIRRLPPLAFLDSHKVDRHVIIDEWEPLGGDYEGPNAEMFAAATVLDHMLQTTPDNTTVFVQGHPGDNRPEKLFTELGFDRVPRRGWGESGALMVASREAVLERIDTVYAYNVLEIDSGVQEA